MKNMKKIVSMLVVLLFSMSIFVSAAETGTITISNAVAGQTYTIWKLLDLESYSTDNKAYSYKLNNTWGDFFRNGAGKAYVTIDDQNYVTWNAGKDTAAEMVVFAKAAQKYADDNQIAGVSNDVAAGSSLVFDQLPLGYYLVDTSLGTLCSLDTTAVSVDIQEKNTVPVLVKLVQEDSNDLWYDVRNDADINQTITFKTEIAAKAGAQNYVFHDEMSAGLTFGEVTKVTITKANTSSETMVDAGNYVVDTTFTKEGNCAACTFHVAFKQEFLDTIVDNNTINVYYTANLNENAVIGEANGNIGNENKARLEYGEGSWTEYDRTQTYTWELDIFKFADTSTNAETPLAGAQFVLKTVFDEGEEQYAVIDDNGKLTGWTMNVNYPDESGLTDVILDKNNNHIKDSEETGEVTGTPIYATILTTGKDGWIKIAGLDGHTTYNIKEVMAPSGYNRLAEDVVVSMDNRGVVSYTGSGNAGSTVKIENKAGTELPTTGGVGTTIFYVLGSILVLGAVVLLVTKRRMNKEY